MILIQSILGSWPFSRLDGQICIWRLSANPTMFFLGLRVAESANPTMFFLLSVFTGEFVDSRRK